MSVKKPSPAARAPVIMWFRRDLRLDDNPALDAASRHGGPVMPLFILDPDEMPGAASRWWLHHSLASLSEALRKCGASLILRRGRPAEILPRLIIETGAGAIFWNRCYEPHAVARDKALKAALGESGVEVASFNGSLLAEPWEVKTGGGDPYKVFTPFWRALSQRAIPLPLPAPKKLSAAPAASDALDGWSLLPVKPDWAGGLRETWQPGERGAQDRLAAFADRTMSAYRDARDMPGREGTSRLSPHLHWGEVSPRRIWRTARLAAEAQGVGTADAFLRELGWRDFAFHLVFHWPGMVGENWKSEFDAFPWVKDDAAFHAWTKGETGYPLVDAGMRELWQTGWMHNRVRMVAASFLVKHLLIDWRRGAEWFEDTLVDADLAVNRASWQWVAGSGADAAPYFRIFNPVLQGEKFDPAGDYVRRYVPELSALDARYIHRPWEAPHDVLAKAGIALGKSWPEPIVDHGRARARALAAYGEIRK